MRGYRIPAWAALGALVALSTLARAWAGSLVETPWIMADEVVYGELGRSLYEDLRLSLLDRPLPFYSLVHPALIGLPLTLFEGSTAYGAAKGFQALVMSLAALPTYLWARELMSERWALASAALAVSIPGLAYSGLLMTEVAFYPVTVAAAWACARAIARRGTGDQLLAVAAIAAACLTRLQAVALVPAFLTAVALEARIARRPPRSLARFAPAVLALAVLAGCWAGWQLRQGGALTDVLGAYRAAAETSYDAGEIARYVLYHLADVALITAAVPLAALVVLLGHASAPHGDARLRAYAVTAASLTFWFALEVGTFASRHVARLAERDLIALAPVLFVGLSAWLSRGMPRPRALSLAGAVAIVLALATLPRHFVSRGALPDAFTVAPLLDLQAAWPDARIGVVTPALAAGLLAFAGVVPRRAAWTVPVVLGVLLASVSARASAVVADESRALRDDLLPARADWIDAAAGGPVSLLYAGDPKWNLVYANLFWNRRVAAVYDLVAQRVPGPIPQESVGPLRDGTLVRADGSAPPVKDVVAPTTVTMFGRPLADAPNPRLVLWRTGGRARISAWVAGVDLVAYSARGDGGFEARADLAFHGRVVIYACGPGAIFLKLVAPEAKPVLLRVSGRTVARVDLGRWQPWEAAVPIGARIPTRRGGDDRDAAARQCEFELVSPGGLVHVERLALRRG